MQTITTIGLDIAKSVFQVPRPSGYTAEHFRRLAGCDRRPVFYAASASGSMAARFFCLTSFMARSIGRATERTRRSLAAE